MPEVMCPRESCGCPTEPDSSFCGARCESQAERLPVALRPRTPCDCGHDTCRPENVHPDQPAPEAQP